MKKILLIPTLLATSVAPLSCLASLTSCGKHNYSKDYLTFEALEDGQLSCDITVRYEEPEIDLDVQYSLNNGTWTKLDVNIDDYTNYLRYKVGDKIRLKGINDYWSFLGEYEIYSSLHFTGLVNASGNIMSLLYGDDFVDQTTIPCDGCFACIFNGYISGELNFAQIKDASNLILPAETLSTACYFEMFSFSKSLVAAPKLPAMTLKALCYKNMFSYCDALKSAPALPATTLADDCYNCMFRDCDWLVNTPELPATTLADGCYYEMFWHCDSLVKAPALPATTLADDCYARMFFDCEFLVDAPALPATTLADGCYYGMFLDCYKLVNAPALPATTLADSCYCNMFKNCTSLIVNTEGDTNRLIFKCPQTEGLIRPVTDMFAGTKGTHDDTPEPGTSYYWAEEQS